MRWRVKGKVSEKGLLFSSGKLLRVILLTRHEMDIMGVRVELKETEGCYGIPGKR